MKVNAYILAADPAWIEASVASYYDLIDRLVVSYDARGVGYTGSPVDVEQCVRRLRQIDHQAKFDYRPGHYARSEFFHQPMENETYQRQCALQQASEDADWVLQLDTDEVVGDTATFTECLEAAHRKDCQAMNYPSHWLYSRVGKRWALEWCERGWRLAPGYPGAMAVRPFSTLTLARRRDGRHYHVDLTLRGSAGRVPHGIAVDRVIPSHAAIWHFSMARDEAWLRRKFATFSHAADHDWQPELDGWLWAQKHPLLKAVVSQFDRGASKRPVRLSRLPATVQSFINASCVSDLQPADARPALA